MKNVALTSLGPAEALQLREIVEAHRHEDTGEKKAPVVTALGSAGKTRSGPSGSAPG